MIDDNGKPMPYRRVSLRTQTVQPQDKYVLRLPDGMRERIKEEAEKNNRSMNAEIVNRLERSFESGQIFVVPEFLAERIAEEAQRNGRTIRHEIHQALNERYPVHDVVLEEQVKELVGMLEAANLNNLQKRRFLDRLKQDVELARSTKYEDFVEFESRIDPKGNRFRPKTILDDDTPEE